MKEREEGRNRMGETHEQRSLWNIHRTLNNHSDYNQKVSIDDERGEKTAERRRRRRPRR